MRYFIIKEVTFGGVIEFEVIDIKRNIIQARKFIEGWHGDNRVFIVQEIK